jgi:uncharacterized membrane protein
LTPTLLFKYCLALSGGIVLIGFAIFLVTCLFVLTLAWAKRPVQSIGQSVETVEGRPYQTIVPVAQTSS